MKSNIFILLKNNNHQTLRLYFFKRRRKESFTGWPESEDKAQIPPVAFKARMTLPSFNPVFAFPSLLPL